MALRKKRASIDIDPAEHHAQEKSSSVTTDESPTTNAHVVQTNGTSKSKMAMLMNSHHPKQKSDKNHEFEEPSLLFDTDF